MNIHPTIRGTGLFITLNIFILSCSLVNFFSQGEHANPMRTEQMGVTDPYKSPNESFNKSFSSGSGWYIFLEQYDDVDPTWSPDGGRIAFGSNRDGDPDIYLIDVDGSNLTNLTPDPSQVLASILFLMDKSVDGWPDWSPAGDQIVFSSSRTNIMMRRVALNIFVMSDDGSDIRQFTDDVDMNILADWSPDNQSLLFSSDREGGLQLYIQNFEGNGTHKLTEGDMENDIPAWSPDGKKIAFESDKDGDFDIYVMEYPGGEITQLTNDPGTDSQPSWSPDGDRIAFTSDRDGDFEIYLMDADGGNVQQLTDNSVTDSASDWSPQGDRIAFISETQEGTRVFLVDTDGANVVQLTGSNGAVLPIEDAIFHLYQGLALHLKLMRQAEGEFVDVIDAYTTAIDMDPLLAEAYLGRGMAAFFSCEIVWMHVIGSELEMFQWKDECPHIKTATADIQTALDLGLAPALTLGVENLLELLNAKQ
jgi:TolB protein